jgi:hypothetical protein
MYACKKNSYTHQRNLLSTAKLLIDFPAQHKFEHYEKSIQQYFVFGVLCRIVL